MEHPQTHFCQADFVIKATVKRTDVVFSEARQPQYEDVSEAATANQTNLVEIINSAPSVTQRVYHIKVKKVFKYTEQYA